MIRLSAGTAACLGLSTSRMDAYPTTAYLLSGNQCRMSCAFCPQSTSEAGKISRLGRITWPEYSWSEIEKAIAMAPDRGIERICLQSVRHENGIVPLLDQISRLKNISSLPLSLSAWIGNAEEAEALIAAGVERLAISIDVVNPIIYRQLKGGSFSERVELLFDCARRLPGRLTTHLICGVGESEEELISFSSSLFTENITTALFALVPLKTTRLENADPPPLDQYRLLQAALFLLKSKIIVFEDLKFIKGRLVSLGLDSKQLKQLLHSGEAFQTSGCPGCNRPYYNERPGGTIYNFHRPLAAEEAAAAVKLVIESASNAINLT
jgi:lipoyl synthase